MISSADYIWLNFCSVKWYTLYKFWPSHFERNSILLTTFKLFNSENRLGDNNNCWQNPATVHNNRLNGQVDSLATQLQKHKIQAEGHGGYNDFKKNYNQVSFASYGWLISNIMLRLYLYIHFMIFNSDEIPFLKSRLSLFEVAAISTLYG